MSESKEKLIASLKKKHTIMGLKPNVSLFEPQEAVCVTDWDSAMSELHDLLAPKWVSMEREMEKLRKENEAFKNIIIESSREISRLEKEIDDLGDQLDAG